MQLLVMRDIPNRHMIMAKFTFFKNVVVARILQSVLLWKGKHCCYGNAAVVRR